MATKNKQDRRGVKLVTVGGATKKIEAPPEERSISFEVRLTLRTTEDPLTEEELIEARNDAMGQIEKHVDESFNLWKEEVRSKNEITK